MCIMLVSVKLLMYVIYMESVIDRLIIYSSISYKSSKITDKASCSTRYNTIYLILEQCLVVIKSIVWILCYRSIIHPLNSLFVLE